MPGPALQRLLDDSLHFPPEYAQQLSSHLPMALAALDGLGAGEARLRAFFAGYVQRFAALPPPAGDVAPLADWLGRRGDVAAFAALRATFATALRRDGTDTALRSALPGLISGVGAAAFHGLIRTAHAVESRHAGELAAALAYWAARWMPLAPPDAACADIDDVPAWLAAIDGQSLRDGAAWRSAAPLIATRMVDVTRSPAYQQAAGRLRTHGQPASGLLHALALAGAARYAATRNFTLLHLATGARAARVLAPWLPSGADALAPLWHAVAAATLASNAVWAAPRPEPASADADWPALRAAGCASDDEHVIKLVHAMAVQHAQAPHPVWQRAAAVALAGQATLPSRG